MGSDEASNADDEDNEVGVGEVGDEEGKAGVSEAGDKDSEG